MREKFKPSIFVKKEEIINESVDPIKEEIAGMFKSEEAKGANIQKRNNRNAKKFPSLDYDDERENSKDIYGDNLDDKESNP